MPSSSWSRTSTGPSIRRSTPARTCRSWFWTPASATSYDPSWLETASAVAICRADQGDQSEIHAAVTAMRERRPYVPVFVLAPGHDDRGLPEWTDWLEGKVRERSDQASRPKAHV